MTFQPLDWYGVEKEMTRIKLGVEYGVSARCRVQDIHGNVCLCYARMTMGSWGFCDEKRNHITSHPITIQRIAWNLLPDLILALAEEGLRLATQMEEATAVLRAALVRWDAVKEQEEHDSMIGLS